MQKTNPSTSLRVNNQQHIAIFAGGCFWCTEAVFQQLKGVSLVESGYAGGDMPNPSYSRVSEGTTGHAEVVRMTFDPSVISYEQLVEIFFLTHDPTTKNRQGNDTGTQYRSVIFYHDKQQKNVAEMVRDRLEKERIYQNSIVTEIVPYTNFYPAEDYHKDYYKRNQEEPYCKIIIDPKLAKLRSRFAQFLK